VDVFESVLCPLQGFERPLHAALAGIIKALLTRPPAPSQRKLGRAGGPPISTPFLQTHVRRLDSYSSPSYRA